MRRRRGHPTTPPPSRPHLARLQVGTLDSLVQLSDTLAKDDHFAEQLTKGLGNQLSSLLNNVKDRLVESLQVDGRTLQNYLSSFRWDSAKFNVNLKSADSLREDINKVRSRVALLT